MSKDQKFGAIIIECLQEVAHAFYFCLASKPVSDHKAAHSIVVLSLFIPQTVHVVVEIARLRLHHFDHAIKRPLIVHQICLSTHLGHDFVDFFQSLLIDRDLDHLAPFVRQLVKHVFLEASHHESRLKQIVKLTDACGAAVVHTVRGRLWIAVPIGELLKGWDHVWPNYAHNVVDLNWFVQNRSA